MSNEEQSWFPAAQNTLRVPLQVFNLTRVEFRLI